MRASSVLSILTFCIVSLGVSPAFGAAAPNKQSDVIETSKGPLRLTPIYHGSLMLEFDGKIIHVDPWSQADYAGFPQADMILSTHTHADHMDPMMINKLRKPSTILSNAARRS